MVSKWAESIAVFGHELVAVLHRMTRIDRQSRFRNGLSESKPAHGAGEGGSGYVWLRSRRIDDYYTTFLGEKGSRGMV